jgi:CBS domain-containing protein
VLLSLVEDPEWLDPTLLIVLSTLPVQSALLGVRASRLFGAWGVLCATIVNVTLFFVVAEVAPKTWAIQHTDRAALASARPIKALANWGPLKLLSKALIGFTNVDNRGLSGIELQYDALLHGADGYMIMQRDGLGHNHLADPVEKHMSKPFPLIGSGEPVSAATKALGDTDALMVVDDGKPAGVITRHDLLGFLTDGS